jgi:predicted phage terminase large subunit-like protein
MTLPKLPLSLAEYRFILRRDLTSFFAAAFYVLNPETRYVPGPHIELMAQALEKCRTGETRRLIINIPPRSLKSHCISIAFTAWLLGHDPSKRIICASYGQDLADKLARDTRNLMSAGWYKALFNARLGERQAVHDFDTTQSGGRMATSVGGVLTGRGADIIILDDPLKPDEAISEAQRQGVNDWFDNSLLSRLNDKATGCIIIVMQRVHQDDLVGHVLEQGHWDMVSFPAITEEDCTYTIESALGRRTVTWRQGEPLHSAREPLPVLDGLKRSMGEYNFSAQYQQRPLPPGGAIVKTEWLKHYDPGSEPGKFQMIIQSWDTANKAGELNDFSVCTTWGVYRNLYYLLHVYRRRVMFPDLKRALIQLKNDWRPNRIIIEDKVSGIQLIQEARVLGINVTSYTPSSRSDKETRLHAQTSPFENGRVLLPTGASWLSDYIIELTGFPGAKYDDQVDSTTQFLDYMTSHQPFVVTQEMVDQARRAPPYRRPRSMT